MEKTNYEKLMILRSLVRENCKRTSTSFHETKDVKVDFSKGLYFPFSEFDCVHSGIVKDLECTYIRKFAKELFKFTRRRKNNNFKYKGQKVLHDDFDLDKLRIILEKVEIYDKYKFFDIPFHMTFIELSKRYNLRYEDLYKLKGFVCYLDPENEHKRYISIEYHNVFIKYDLYPRETPDSVQRYVNFNDTNINVNRKNYLKVIDTQIANKINIDNLK